MAADEIVRKAAWFIKMDMCKETDSVFINGTGKELSNETINIQIKGLCKRKNRTIE